MVVRIHQGQLNLAFRASTQLLRQLLVRSSEVQNGARMSNTKPYIAAAFLCERLLQEKDGVITAIRIVDTFFVPPAPEGVIPKDLPSGFKALPTTEFALLVSLKSGDLRGEFSISLKWRSPSGKIVNVGEETPALLNGEEHGVNLSTRLRLGVEEYGLHWLDVFWNGDLLTSIPFKLVQDEPPMVGER